MTETEFHLLRSLAWMCDQYLSESPEGGLDHMCMSAGEDAVDLLVGHGLVKLDGRGGTWTEAGLALLRSHPGATFSDFAGMVHQASIKT